MGENYYDDWYARLRDAHGDGFRQGCAAGYARGVEALRDALKREIAEQRLALGSGALDRVSSRLLPPSQGEAGARGISDQCGSCPGTAACLANGKCLAYVVMVPAAQPAPSRPTIAELEAILSSTEAPRLEFLPNGEVRAVPAQPAPSPGDYARLAASQRELTADERRAIGDPATLYTPAPSPGAKCGACETDCDQPLTAEEAQDMAEQWPAPSKCDTAKGPCACGAWHDRPAPSQGNGLSAGPPICRICKLTSCACQPAPSPGVMRGWREVDAKTLPWPPPNWNQCMATLPLAGWTLCCLRPADHAGRHFYDVGTRP